jgi:hypothetical protein
MLDVNGTAKIGVNGDTITEIIQWQVNRDLPNINNNAVGTLTFAVPNAAVGSSVVVSPSVALPNGLLISYARVSAANTVEVKIANESGGNINFGVVTFYFMVIR